MQLPLDLGMREDASFDNYVAGSNEQVVFNLKRLLSGEGERFIFLWGNKGAGVSHLLQASCYAFCESGFGLYLSMDEIMQYDEEAIYGLEEAGLVCIDNLQSMVGEPKWEVAIFHLFNRIRDCGGRLLVGADFNPFSSEVHLPDLASRLTWGLTLEVKALSDDERQMVLQERAMHLGIELSSECQQFILNRAERTVGALMDILEALDKASLAQKRRITMPFIKAVMNW